MGHASRERVRQSPLQIHAVVIPGPLRIRLIDEVQIGGSQISVSRILDVVVLHPGAIKTSRPSRVIVHDERFHDERYNQGTLITHSDYLLRRLKKRLPFGRLDHLNGEITRAEAGADFDAGRISQRGRQLLDLNYSALRPAVRS